MDANLVVKIADFGLSRDLADADEYFSGDVKAKLPVKWMAPESLARRVYNEKTDVVCTKEPYIIYTENIPTHLAPIWRPTCQLEKELIMCGKWNGSSLYETE